MSTYHCTRCGRAIFRAEDIIERVNLWDLREYQAECFAVSAVIDIDELTRYDASLHEGWYCCRFIAMRMVVDKFGTGRSLLVYCDSVAEVSAGEAPPTSDDHKGQHRLSARDYDAVLAGDSLKGVLAVVKYGAIWCPPCRLMDRVCARLAREARLPGVRFFEVDVDEERALAARWSNGAIPFFVFYYNGGQVRLRGRGPAFIDGGLVGGVGEARLSLICQEALSAARAGARELALGWA